MNKDKLHNLFNKIKGNKETTITVTQSDIGAAEEGFIIPEDRRGGWWSRFLVRQSGGYDSQYYTASEAKKTTVLAAAKFMSVSLATFSFMKAAAPAFENQVIVSLPSIAGVDPKYILMGASSAALWWGISKLDTAVMHGLRYLKAARYASDHYGVENADTKKSSLPSVLFRLGISAGSLGISIPALLVTTSERTIDRYIQDGILEGNNQAIIQQYEGNLATIESEVARLTGVRVQIEQGIVDIYTEAGEPIYTQGQETRLSYLLPQLQAMEAERISLQQAQAAEQRVYDAAVSRRDQELDGTRGATPGIGPNYRDAVADMEDSDRRLQTIATDIARIDAGISLARGEIESINLAGMAARELRNSTNASLLADLERQRDENREDLNAQMEARTLAQDVNALAAADPRFVHFNPDMTERVDAYVEYMVREANPMEWSQAIFFALMAVCMELGVFVLSGRNAVNPGELRGYMADLAKSREAAGILNKAMMRMHLKSESDMDRERVEHGKKKYLLDEDRALFMEIVETATKDPVFRQKVSTDVTAMLDANRLKTGDRDPDAESHEVIGIDPHKLNGANKTRVNGHTPGPGLS